ncbi:hypothetical protein KAJ02_09715, partial [Candidatus Bipolaricaulota bacterium]|nr:hypothetical protein [Candidatus Bipolaricaulota bacterium]
QPLKALPSLLYYPCQAVVASAYQASQGGNRQPPEVIGVRDQEREQQVYVSKRYATQEEIEEKTERLCQARVTETEPKKTDPLVRVIDH